MARREWAEREARKRLHPSEFDEYSCTYENALKHEHARAVRIVKRAKRLELHGLRDTDTNEFLEGYEAACVDILSVLTKGRA